ncbi:MAG: Calx-beta domain-containing protein [Acidimicrobiales bacterium]
MGTTRDTTNTLGRPAALGLGWTAFVHVGLAPEHLQEDLQLGVGFLGAGVVSLAIAMWLWNRGGRRSWLVAGLVSSAMAGAYVVSRSVGLLGGHHQEPWDALGLTTLSIEAGITLTALFLLYGRRMANAVAAGLVVMTGSFGLAPVTPAMAATLPPPAPFQLALPVPPTLSPVSSDATTDYYNVTAEPGTAQMLPGTPRTPVWTYNGTSPGPTIRQRAGRTAKVTVTNKLNEKTNVHLHGAHVQPESDGAPMDTIATNASRVYTYPNDQSARTMWYHDHVMDLTGPHVYKGLAGFYLLSDSFEDGLNLPTGANDIPIVIQDRLFNTDATLSYPPATAGLQGDTIVVNGTAQPFFKVADRKYRFRLLNGSSARQYKLALSNGKPLVQVGSEGGLLPAPVSQASITLGPAERADVVVDFSGLPLNTKVVLQNLSGTGSTAEIMRFDVSRSEGDASTVPATMRSFTPPSGASLTRDFALSRTNSGSWLINGKAFDHTRIDANPTKGTTEIWKFQNNSFHPHVMHLHDVNFQVLDINGQKPPPGRDAMTEMVNIPGGGSASIIVNFNGYEGTYVFHCHVLEHEDNGMLAQFKVSGSTSPPTTTTTTTPTTTTTTTAATVPGGTAPSLSVGDMALTEGDAKARTAYFPVTLSKASAQTVTVNYATATGTAVGADFTAKSGTLTLAAGKVKATIAVPVKGDTADEADEAFSVNLSAPTNATIGDGTGTGTVRDDDPDLGIRATIGDVTTYEGNAGAQTATFTVSLSAPSVNTVTVNYATADGTAVTPSDYTTKTGTVTFAPGAVSKSVAIPVKSNTGAEPNETFSVVLSNPTGGATVTDGTGVGTIRNDD